MLVISSITQMVSSLEIFSFLKFLPDLLFVVLFNSSLSGMKLLEAINIRIKRKRLNFTDQNLP